MMGGEGNQNPNIFLGKRKKWTSPVLLDALTPLAAWPMRAVLIKKMGGDTHAITPCCLSSAEENRANAVRLMQGETQGNGRSAAAPSPLPARLTSPAPHTGIRRDAAASTPKPSSVLSLLQVCGEKAKQCRSLNENISLDWRLLLEIERFLPAKRILCCFAINNPTASQFENYCNRKVLPTSTSLSFTPHPHSIICTKDQPILRRS